MATRTVQASLVISALVIILAYALVGGEEHPGIVVGAGELARNAADRTQEGERVDTRPGTSDEPAASEAGSFAENDIGPYNRAPGPEAESGPGTLPADLPSAEGDRPGALVTPEMAEQALARDIAAAIPARSGS